MTLFNPGQTPPHVMIATLVSPGSKKSFSLGPAFLKKISAPHVSIYILTIDDQHKWKTRPSIRTRLVDSETTAKMYERVCNFMREEGYHHYEVSNFSKPGFQSKNNSNYWNTDSDYLGFGPGAHGYLQVFFWFLASADFAFVNPTASLRLPFPGGYWIATGQCLSTSGLLAQSWSRRVWKSSNLENLPGRFPLSTRARSEPQGAGRIRQIWSDV